MNFYLYLSFLLFIFLIFLIVLLFLRRFLGRRGCILFFILFSTLSFLFYYYVQAVFLHLVYFYVFSVILVFLILFFYDSHYWPLFQRLLNFLIFFVNILFGLISLICLSIFLVSIDFSILGPLRLLNYYTRWLELIVFVFFFIAVFLCLLWLSYDHYVFNGLLLLFFLFFLCYFIHFDDFNYFFEDIFYSQISRFCLFDLSNFDNFIVYMSKIISFLSYSKIIFGFMGLLWVVFLILLNLFYLFFFFLSIFFYLCFTYVVVCLGSYIWVLALILILGFLILKNI